MLISKGLAGAAVALIMVVGTAQAQYIVKRYAVDYDVQADGRYTKTEHSEMAVTNDAAAKDAGQQTVPFSEQLEDLDIVEAYTLKRDGRRVTVEGGAIFSQMPQGAPQVPMFNDQRQKVIVFPDVAAGDTVVYTARRRMKQPITPGQFSTWSLFPRTVTYNDVRFTVTAPKTMPLRVEAHEMVVEKSSKDDKTVYLWRYASRGALVEDVAATSLLDRAPRAFISSFKDYDDLGRSYAVLAAPKARVTPKIAALADQITAGSTDRRQQAQKIYEWVSREIRYVSIALGRGAVVPHDAETVLANRYGDCKDHVVLFDALLKAKGIDSEMALINLGNSYKLSEVPTYAQLNHVISWLPEFGIYLDTTLGVAPFGVLAFEEYGKPVVHAGVAGAMRKTPVVPPGSASSTVKTTFRLQADGRASIDTAMSANGPLAVLLRESALNLQSGGAERVARSELRQRNMEGSGNYRFSAPKTLALDYSISAHFDVEPLPHLLAGNSFSLTQGMGLLWAPGDLLMGPIALERLRDTEATPCYTGQIVEELSIELPPGRRIAKLPEPKTVETPNLRYMSSYAFDGRVVSVRREFASRIDQPLCTGEVRKAVVAAFQNIRSDYRAQVALTAD